MVHKGDGEIVELLFWVNVACMRGYSVVKSYGVVLCDSKDGTDLRGNDLRHELSCHTTGSTDIRA
jgi:hypothetical protein